MSEIKMPQLGSAQLGAFIARLRLGSSSSYSSLIIARPMAHISSLPLAMLHSGSKSIKPAENKFTQSDFKSLSKQDSANSYNFRFRSYSKIVKFKNSKNWDNPQQCITTADCPNFLNQTLFGGFLCLIQLCGAVDDFLSVHCQVRL